MEGTVSSFGDYDSCLQTSLEDDFQGSLTGKYCSFKLKPVSPKGRKNQHLREIDQVLQERIPVFDYYFIQQSLCLPSTCSDVDAANIIDHTLRGLPFERKLNIQCDTKDSISFQGKINSASTSQWIASLFLGTIIFLVILGSLEEMIRPSKSILTLRHFSAVTSTNRLLMIKDSGRLSMLDYCRLSIIIFGTAGHTIGCLETVTGWYTVSKLYAVKESLKLFWVQPLINEGPLGIGITYVGGFVTFWAVEKAVNTNRVNYVAAVFDRWIRYMPSLMAMVAIDILWPFFGDGPMYSQVSKHLLNKCTRNAWMNFFFVGNMKSAPENVSLS